MTKAHISASPAPGVGFSAWWMVGVLFTLNVFSILDRLILTMLVGNIKADLLISDFQMSMILGPAFAIFYAAFGLPLGWAVDRFRRPPIIFFGVLFWSVATIVSGFTRSYETLFIARICVGIGEAVLAPAAVSLIADAFPKDRATTALAIYSSAAKIGSAIALALGAVAVAAATFAIAEQGSVLGLTQPWHVVMALVGAPGLILAALAFTFKEPARRQNAAARLVTPGRGGDIIPFLRKRWQLWLAMFIAFNLISILSFALNSWMPTYLDRQFGWTPVQYGAALSVTSLLSAGSLVINGWLVDRFYRRGMKDIHLRFYTWLIMAVLPAFVLMFWIKSPYVALICYALVQFVTVPFFVYIAAVIVMVAPSTVRGRLTALYAASFTILGQGLGPTVVAAITDYGFRDESKLGVSLAIVSLTCVVIALAAVFWALSRMKGAIRDAEGTSDERSRPAEADEVATANAPA
jgi:MFS family permease